MSVLIIAEHDNKAIKPATLSAVTAAKHMGDPISLLVVGHQCEAAANAAARILSIAKVLLLDDPRYQHPLAEDMASLLTRLASSYSHILAPVNSGSKSYMPRCAAMLDVAQISDITAVESADCFQRPIYAGNAIATVQSIDPVKVVTVRASAFSPAAAEGGSASIERIPPAEKTQDAEFLGEASSKSERPELTSARIIVSGGRGMQSGENFVLLERLADLLGAAVGASRAAVDAGFVPNEYQVGQTGKIVAPDLYIAVGLSGAIQHLAGMKDSKVIVAINRDEEAPIFQVADYGLVADLFQAVPALTAELERIPDLRKG